jgi:hypothetical protein
MTTPTTSDPVRRIALDIEDIYDTRRGAKVVNALLASSAEMFRTKRGRLGLLLPHETYSKLRRQLRIDHEDGHDGLKIIRLADELTQPAAA